MSTLDRLRADLRDKLKAEGFNAFSVIPKRVAAPFVSVAPDEPYIDIAGAAENELMWGEYLVNHRLVVVAKNGGNEAEADSLDQMLVRLLRLDLAPHRVLFVGEPGSLLVNGQEHLAVAIHLSVPTPLEDS